MKVGESASNGRESAVRVFCPACNSNWHDVCDTALAMTIRITTIAEPSRTIVKVDGRLQCGDFEELERMIQELEGPAALDLTELQSVDRAVAALLRKLIGLGVELRSASPYVKLLLEPESGSQRRDSEDTA